MSLFCDGSHQLEISKALTPMWDSARHGHSARHSQVPDRYLCFYGASFSGGAVSPTSSRGDASYNASTPYHIEAPMQIWVDADACPAAIKDILFRLAERRQLNVTLIANRLMRVPGSRFIRAFQVPAGADAADEEIVGRVEPGDIVVTGDIPLASQVLEKGGLPLNPRGEWYTKDSIAQQLGMRAFMEELRASGVDTGGPSSFSHADRQNFANALDRELARRRTAVDH